MIGVLAAWMVLPAAAAPLDAPLSNWRAESGIKGIAAACVQDGRLRVGGAGRKGPRGTAYTAQTPSYVGSLTKMMVSTAAMQLMEGGHLDPDEALARWQPEFPNARDITVSQLMAMRSGTLDYFSADPANPILGRIAADIRRIWTTEQLLETIAQEPPRASPGADHSYSNTDYILLGTIIEARGEIPLPARLQADQFAPLGLDDTRLAGPDRPVPSVAHGYVRGSAFLFGRQDAFWVGRDDYAGLESLAGAAGGVVSTASDLALWMDAFASGGLVSEAGVRRLVFGGDPASPYGLGFERFETAFGPAFGHHGSTPGYAALSVHYSEPALSVAIVTNDEAGEPGLLDLAMTLARGPCANVHDQDVTSDPGH